jgi:hypothetical protein
LNLILHLKELWRRRVLVAAAVAVAATISILAVFQVSLSPPGISKHSKVEAQGSIEILVDSARSPIADAQRDLEGLVARAGVFARYMAGGDVVSQIARANDIPVNRIDVVGPEPLPGQAPGIDGGSLQLNPYEISVVQSGNLPILTVVTRAPTVEEARGLAAAAPAAVRRVVRVVQAQQGTPLGRRVGFRELGPAEAGLVDESIGKKAATMIFLVLLTLFIVAILGIPRLVFAWRSADSSQGPELVPLPGSRSEPEREAWNSRGP